CTERQRNERVAEELASDFGERKDPDDLAVPLHRTIVRAMAKDVFDDFSPSDPVKKCCLGTFINESIPARLVARSKSSHDLLNSGPCTATACRCGIHQARNTRSTRSHRKSPSNPHNFGCMRRRLT